MEGVCNSVHELITFEWPDKILLHCPSGATERPFDLSHISH